MLGCKYTINIGNHIESFSSQEELDDFISKNQRRIEAALNNTPVRFSKNFNPQEEVMSVLKDLKNREAATIEYDIQGTKVEIINNKIIKGYKGVTRRINDEIRDEVTGRLVLEPFNEENYRKYKLDQLITDYKNNNSEGLTDAQIEDKALRDLNNMVASWKMMSSMGTEIHKLSSIFFDNQIDNADILWEAYEKQLEGKPNPFRKVVVEDIFNILAEFEKETVKRIGGGNVQFLTEVPIYDENTSTVGVIDLIAVDEEGNAYIADFKTSYKNTEDWDRDKRTRYQYQMALYRQLLNAKDINVADAWVIPVILKSTDNINKVVESIDTDVIDKLGLQLDTVLNEVSYTAKQMIPAKEIQLKFENTGVVSDNIQKFFSLSGERDLKLQYEQFVKSEVKHKNNKPYFKDGRGVKSLKEIIPNPRTEEEKRLNIENELYNKSAITRFLNTRNNSKGAIASSFKIAWKQMINTGNYTNPFTEGSDRNYNAETLNTARKAVERYINGQWEIYDFAELEEHGIITFKNISGNFLEFLAISNENLNNTVKLKYGNTLLGDFVSNTSAVKIDYSLPAQRKYLEGIKILSVLNEHADLLKSRNLSVHMIRTFSFEHSQLEALNLWSLKKNFEALAGKTQTPYNLANLKTTSAAETLFASIASVTDADIERSLSVKVLLKKLNNSLGAQFPDNRELLNELVKIQKGFQQQGFDRHLRYDKKLDEVYGFLNAYITELAGVDNDQIIESRGDMKKWAINDSTMFSSFHELNSRVARVALLPMRMAMDRMRQNYLKFNNDLRPVFKEFYEAQGVSTLIGNHQQAFMNLYEKDVNGKLTKDFRFKDPEAEIGNNDYLNPAERKFLNIVIPIMGKYMYGDAKYPAAKEKGDHLNVPLLHASATSKFIEGGPIGWVSSTFDPHVTIDAFEVFQEQEMDVRKAAEEMNEMYDKYNLSRSPRQRQEFIEGHETIDYEKNFEIVFGDLIYTSMKVEAYNGALPIMNAVIANSMLYEMGFANKNLENTYDYIVENIRMSVFQERNIEDHQIDTHKRLAQLKHAVSMLQLGLSPLNAVRETLQGQWANISKLASKRYGDETPSLADWSWALGRITGEMGDFLHTVTLTEELNHLYGLANMDTHQLAEKMRISKTGAYQFSSRWWLWFMGAPDYINRMAFMLAKMRKDGSYEAHTMDGEKLVYNWKKDKRFSVYASGDKSHADYNKQRALYLIHMKAFNDEILNTNSSDPILKEGDDLPRAYTNDERESIKAFVNYVHGPYDHEDKILFQNTLFGVMFSQFKTWLISKKMQYFMKPDTYRIGGYKQMTNPNGELMYMTDDGELTTEVTNNPVMEWKGRYMEGIWQSIMRTVSIVMENGTSFNKSWEQISNDSEIKSNMQLMVLDLSLFMLMSVFIAGIIPWDDLEEDNKASAAFLKAVVDSTSDLSVIRNIEAITNPTAMFPAFGYIWKNFNNVMNAVTIEEPDMKNLVVRSVAPLRFVDSTTTIFND